MKRLSISRAWDETAAFLTREMRLLVPLALALMFLPAVIAGLVMPRGSAAVMTASAPFLLLFLFELAIGALGQLAIARLALGHREELGASIRHAAARLPSYFAALMIVAAPLSLALGVALGTARTVATSGNAALALILLLLITVLMVSLIIVGVRCMLNTAVAAVENGGPVAILKRGFALTRGQVLRLLGAALLFFIGGGVAILALTSVVGLLTAVALGPPEPWTVAALLIAVAGAAGQAALGVVFTVFFARLYAQRAAETSVPSSGT